MKQCRTQPCETCPYRQDVPSGIWQAHEYQKLPEYDLPTYQQPVRAFYCHTSPDFLCTGWAVCHENRGRGERLLALRMVASKYGLVEIPEATVPLFSSGAEAAAHGMRDIKRPTRRALRAMAKVLATRARKETK